jgi:DNA-binding Lrp family transcriptional regulator
VDSFISLTVRAALPSGEPKEFKMLRQKIIQLLKDDARLAADKIAVMLGVGKADIEREIAAMEKSGVIVKYAALINEEAVNSGIVEALIEVKVSPVKSTGFDDIAAQITGFKEVKSLYLMSGAYDLAVFIEGNSLREASSFVSQKLSVMDKVLSTATHFILKKYKSEGVELAKNDAEKRLPVHL